MLAKLLLTILISAQVFASVNSGEVLGVQTQEAGDRVEISGPTRINPKNLGVKISAASGIVIDKESGKILFAKNIHQQRPIASITKLMTALTFLDTQPDLEKVIEVLPEDLSGVSKKNLLPNEKIKIHDLLYLCLINSDNNATKILVKSTDLSTQEFIEKMNIKAKGMGLINTFFEGVVGLSENNLSTAYEVARILDIASRHSIIKKILPVSEYNFKSESGESHYIQNTNKLLNTYLNIIAGKTGFTDEAGSCFASIIKLKNKKEVVSVILGSPEIDGRFQDTKAVVSWVSENYEW